MSANKILEKSAKLTAPSVCSSVSELQNINPNITKRSGSCLNDSGPIDNGDRNEDILPVQITPMLKTRLDRLAEKVTAPNALNEPSEIARSNSRQSTTDSKSGMTLTSDEKDKASIVSSIDIKPESSRSRRLPEHVAVLEQLFLALQMEASKAALLPALDVDDASSTSSHPSLTGHTALLVRVLLGLVSRVQILEERLETTTKEMEDLKSRPSFDPSKINEKLENCERKIESFQETLRMTSDATSESLQRIRSELENIVIEKSPPPVNNSIVNGETGGPVAQKVSPLSHMNLFDPELELGDDFDSEPWNDAPKQELAIKNDSEGNEENISRPISGSPAPSSIRNEPVSSLFGDRGAQIADLIRQHEQARARLNAMQRNNQAMGSFIDH